MAYTDIPTVSVGDLYTAANFNTHLRDNFAAGIPDKFTAQGDIGVGAGADTIGILTLGTAGQCLTADAAEILGVKWAAPTGFFDWFTFGAFTCATLDHTQAPSSSVYVEGVSTHFGIDNTGGSRVYLATFSAIRTDTFIISGEIHPYAYIQSNNQPWMFNRVHGDSNSTNWYENTQAGILVSGSNDTLGIELSHNPSNVSFALTLKIWGWA